MSEVKVNKISPRTACGTVTLGDSGDTFTIPAGATITNSGTAAGFGATGAASWDTTVKTSGFTAVSGVGYFVNTTAGAITVTLPASPSAGDVVAVKDYANTWDTNNLTLGRNGSNIGGAALDSIISTEGLAVTLVYVDATKGWLVTDSGLQSETPTAEFIVATSPCVATVGNYKIHTFTGPGTFTVCSVGNAAGSNSIDYLVVAGGGGGGQVTEGGAGGGGGGGFRLSNGTCMSAPQTSPLAVPAAVPVSVQGYPIVIGGGGAGGTNGRSSPPASPKVDAANGVNSSAFSIVSAGGGGGAGGNFPYPGCCAANGLPGGSGGGGHGNNTPAGGTFRGTGNTPPVSPAQGQNGGNGNASSVDGSAQGGGGGGGAGAVGTAYSPTSPGSPPYQAGPGGVGSFVVQTGFGGCNGTTGPVSGARYFSGGGGAGRRGTPPNGNAGVGGSGGGGAGTPGDSASNGVTGTINTGGGGGGGGRSEISPTSPAGGNGGAGGSGIVVIRYKFQN
jgi:hypothetical protein